MEKNSVRFFSSPACYKCRCQTVHVGVTEVGQAIRQTSQTTSGYVPVMQTDCCTPWVDDARVECPCLDRSPGTQVRDVDLLVVSTRRGALVSRMDDTFLPQFLLALRNIRMTRPIRRNTRKATHESKNMRQRQAQPHSKQKNGKLKCQHCIGLPIPRCTSALSSFLCSLPMSSWPWASSGALLKAW